MASRHTFRPENVLRRAEDLMGVDQSEAALQTLYDFLTRRKRSVVASELEPIALLFVELGVNLRNGKVVKDGLHQYKRSLQTVEDGLASVATVVKKFVELSEAKLAEAQEKADDVAAAAAATRLEDEEEHELTPEELLMSSVSTEDTRDRSDRDLISPWLRFCWEAYRTVLDIIRNNSKLESTYIAIVNQAFNFCVTYSRKTEFRRLCELLRGHLQTITGGDSQSTDSIDLSDAESFQRFIESRFQQLNVSVKLELWQESFRTVEDIHNLMTTSKRQPKPNMMVNYYENLAKIFAVSENHLFHAAARQKYFGLISQSPIATPEEVSKFATLQMLSALSVPIVNSNNESSNEDFNKRKNQRLSTLLNLTKVPTRESLIDQLSDKTLLKIAYPDIVELLNLLETDFHPLVFASKSKNAFKAIQSNDDLKSYIKPLLEVVLFKLFKQVSEVYESIKLEYLIKLATFEGDFLLTPIEIENFLLKAAADDSLYMKIDHESRIVNFKSDPFDDSVAYNSEIDNALQTSPADLIRSQLTNLARGLTFTLQKIDPSIQARLLSIHQRSLQAANAPTTGFFAEKESLLKRDTILEARKKELIQIKREEEDAANRARAEALAAAKQAEKERVEQEAARKAEEKRRRELEEIARTEKQNVIDKINATGIITIDSKEAEGLDTTKLQAMQLQKLAENKKQLEQRVESISKKYTYIERAQRKYELPMWAKDAEEQKERDQKAYEEMKAKLVANAKKEHEQHIKLRDRLKKIVPDFQSITYEARTAQYAAYEKAKLEAEEKLAAAKQERIAQAIAKKKAQLEAEEAERELAERKAEEEREKEAAREAARLAREKAANEAREAREKAAREASAASASASSSAGAFKFQRRGGRNVDATPPASSTPLGRASPASGSPFGRASPASSSPFGRATPVDSPAPSSPTPAAASSNTESPAPAKFSFRKRGGHA